MTETLTQEPQEFPPDDEEKRYRKSREKIAHDMVAEMRITRTNTPFQAAGIKLDGLMLTYASGEYQAIAEEVEKVIQQAQKSAEEYLREDNPERNPFLALKIAGEFVLPRELLQRAGNTWLQGERHWKGTEKEATYDIVVSRFLDWDYLPPADVLEEALRWRLSHLAKRKDQTGLMQDYQRLSERLREHNIQIEGIVEKDPELLESLTSPGDERSRKDHYQ